jgi:hypothetical protein
MVHQLINVLSATFHEHIDLFMKLFLDDFIVFSTMDMHFNKLGLCFLKFQEYEINLNPKNVFLWFSRLILRFIISKEGKLPYPKKIQLILNMLIPTTLAQI